MLSLELLLCPSLERFRAGAPGCTAVPIAADATRVVVLQVMLRRSMEFSSEVIGRLDRCVLGLQLHLNVENYRAAKVGIRLVVHEGQLRKCPCGVLDSRGEYLSGGGGGGSHGQGDGLFPLYDQLSAMRVQGGGSNQGAAEHPRRVQGMQQATAEEAAMAAERWMAQDSALQAQLLRCGCPRMMSSKR